MQKSIKPKKINIIEIKKKKYKIFWRLIPSYILNAFWKITKQKIVNGIERLPKLNTWPDEITIDFKINSSFIYKKIVKKIILSISFKFAFIPNLSSKIPKIKIIKIKNKILKFKIELFIKVK